MTLGGMINRSRARRRLAPALATGLLATTLVVGVSAGTVLAVPSVSIEKSTNGVDSDVAPGEDIIIGSVLTWEYVVTNTGDTDLIDVVVVDDQGLVVTCDTTTLAPAEVATCTATGIAGLGGYTNVGTVTAQPVDALGAPDGPTVTANDASNYTGVIGTTETTCFAVSDGPPDNDAGTDALVRMVVQPDGTLAIDNLGLLTTDDGAEVKSIEGIAIERGTSRIYSVDDAENELLITEVYDDDTVVTRVVAPLSIDVDVDGLTVAGNTLFGVVRIELGPDELIEIDPATGVVTPIGLIDDFPVTPPNVIQDVDDIGWDDTTNTLFGVIGSAALNYLIQIDPTTGDGVYVSPGQPATDDLEGLGVSDFAGTDGTLFGVTGTTGEFFLLNKTSGAAAFIGNLAVPTMREDFEGVDCHELQLLERGSIGDTVWFDFDADGTQGALEVGIPGVTVNLLDDAGNVIATAVTDAVGQYLFNDLLVDQYTVQVDTSTLPAGYSQTFDADGVATPHTSVKDLASAEDDRLQDFGYTAIPASLGDTVWSDTDADGVQDAGEAGVAGVAVTLLADLDGDGVPETTIATDTTDAMGNYLFEGLNPSLTYYVEFASGELTVQNQGDDAADSDADPVTGLTGPIMLDPGEFDDTIDAGIARGAIGDRIWADDDGDGIQDTGEDGISGVTVNLLDADGNVIATTTTDDDGRYLFGDLPPGTYTVQVDATTLPADVRQTFDADGLGTAGQSTVTIGVGETDLDQDFGYQPLGTIGDTVWLDTDGDGVLDADESGIADVTVTLVDAGGNVVGTTTTGPDGTYLFEDLPGGDYTVRVDPTTLPADLVPTFDNDGTGSANESATSIGAGDDDLDQDFGYSPPGSIGDTVWLDADGDGVLDPGEAGIADVTVTLFDADGMVVATAVTDSNGKYLFPGLPSGTYCVQVDETTLPVGVLQTSSPNAITIPGCATFDLAPGEDNLDQDFGYRPPANPTLPETGGGANGLVPPAFLLLSLGALALLASRRRRFGVS